MIGKIIGGLVGAQVARHSSRIGGTGGAILGALAVPVISRMRMRTLLLLGAGGYVAKKVIDRKRQESTPENAENGAETGTTSA